MKPPISFRLVGVVWLFTLAISVGGAALGYAYGKLTGSSVWTCTLIGWAISYTGSLLIAFSWYKSLFDHQDETPKPYQAETINVHATLDDGAGAWWGVFIDGLNIDPERFYLMTCALTRDPSFTGTRFGGKGKLFSPDDFEALRERLKTAELVRQRNPINPNPGYELTSAGKAIMKKIAFSREVETVKR